jgi:ABC-type transport system involved in multi-copper enzyme maturation permease subunit
MWATYLSSLQESVSRRVALVLFGVAVLVAAAFNWIVHVVTTATGAPMIAIGTQPPVSPVLGAPAVLQSEIHAAGSLWLLLATFAAAPLLATTLEKGWLELVFSKGTARWRIFLGRFLGGLTLYAATFAVATIPVAARLWWVTGVSTWRIAIALVIQTFSFAALLSVAALVTLPQRSVALPVIASAALWVLCPALARREESFYQLLSSHFAREVVDWAYRILPKCTELEDLSAALIQTSTISSWWPIWSTGLFTLSLIVLTLWLLQRRSF